MRGVESIVGAYLAIVIIIGVMAAFYTLVENRARGVYSQVSDALDNIQSTSYPPTLSLKYIDDYEIGVTIYPYKPFRVKEIVVKTPDNRLLYSVELNGLLVEVPYEFTIPWPNETATIVVVTDKGLTYYYVPRSDPALQRAPDYIKNKVYIDQELLEYLKSPSQSQDHVNTSNLKEEVGRVSSCTILLSRFLSDQDLFQLLTSNYYVYNCSTAQYPVSSIDFTVYLDYDGNHVAYTITGSDGTVWGTGEVTQLPALDYVLLGSKRLTYNLGVGVLTVDVHVYYKFPEVGVVVDANGNYVSYVYAVPKLVVVHQFTHEGYLEVVTTRASCTSASCYLLYALRDAVDYPWMQYSGDLGWLLLFYPGTWDVGQYSYLPIRAYYKVSAKGVTVSFRDPYSYIPISSVSLSQTWVSTIEAYPDVNHEGYWLPRDFYTPVPPYRPQSWVVYVERALSLYNATYARIPIPGYCSIDYYGPATHKYSLQLRYGGDKSIYLFLLGSY